VQIQRFTINTMHYSTSLPVSNDKINLAMIPAELQTLIFALSILASAGLVLFLLARRFPVVSAALSDIRHHIKSLFNAQRREARLHKVICYHCRKGMGVYNPIYRTYEGISYIEGTCSSCGTYIKARLR
jgi:hypothetical protein